MIVYSSNKKGFLSDVLSGQVEQQILTSFVRELGHTTGKSEVNSWCKSMPYMSNVINDSNIPDDAGIAIEYKIPQTSKRIDFIITGTNSENRKVAVIVELKQWSEGVSLTEKDGVLNTNFYGEVPHPSYQVWSYATLLEDFNSAVQTDNISLVPCAYLHNYEKDDVITNDFYKEYTNKAPVFLKTGALALQEFIKRFVMKNIGNGPAFMIRVVFNEVFFMDTQRRWKIELNLPRLRSLEKGEKRIMEINLFENGVQKEISDFTATAIRSLRLENTVYFTDAMSERYYIKIITGYDMIEFDPPVKLNIVNKSILFLEQHIWPIRIRFNTGTLKKLRNSIWSLRRNNYIFYRSFRSL